MSERTAWLGRLDAVEQRLVRAADRHLTGLTAPDQPSGEQWDAGQVWAHLAEFGEYWLDELDMVLVSDEVIDFGRVKTDDARIAAIEHGRGEPIETHLAVVRRSIARLRDRLESMTGDDWKKAGRHSTLGVMDIAAQMQHFHVGHYEEHADQLESLE